MFPKKKKYEKNMNMEKQFRTCRFAAGRKSEHNIFELLTRPDIT